MYYDADDYEFKDYDIDDYYYDDYYDDEIIQTNVMVKIIENEGPEMQYLSEFPSTYGRYIIIDAEFTGLDEKEDQLLELAANEVKNLCFNRK